MKKKNKKMITRAASKNNIFASKKKSKGKYFYPTQSTVQIEHYTFMLLLHLRCVS